MSSKSSRYNMFVSLTFASTQARNDMRRTGVSFNRLANRITRAGRAISYGAYEVAGSLARMGAATTAFALVTGKSFVDFQRQMSSVRSVIGTEAAGAYDLLHQRAKELMTTTRYTGAEVAEGMEQMIRQGMSGIDTYHGIAGVLNAAAAENMNLADAAQIVSTTMRTFQMEATQATEVANTMAATSMASGTNMNFLASSIRYGAGQAATMGISLRDMNVAFGMMANMGMKGTMAGTSFNQMLVSLQRNAPKTQKVLEQLGVETTDEKGQFVGLFGEEGILEQLQRGLSQYAPMDQGKLLAEAFNIRGARAVQRLLGAMAQPEVVERLERAVDSANEGIGAAQRMANIKLWNISGQFKLLRDAITGVTNELWENFTPGFTASLANLVGKVQNVGTALVYMGTDFPTQELTDSFHRIDSKYKEFAMGLVDGLQRVRYGVIRTGRMLRTHFNISAESLGDNVSNLVTMLGYLSALGPTALSAMFAMRILSGSIRMLGGIASIAFSPLAPMIAGAAVLLRVLGKEGDNAFDTLIKVTKTFGKLLDTLVVKPLNFIRSYIGDLLTIAGVFGAIGTAWGVTTVAKYAIGGKLAAKGGILGDIFGRATGAGGVPVRVTNVSEMAAAQGIVGGASGTATGTAKGILGGMGVKAVIKKIVAGLGGVSAIVAAAIPLLGFGGAYLLGKHIDKKEREALGVNVSMYDRIEDEFRRRHPKPNDLYLDFLEQKGLRRGGGVIGSLISKDGSFVLRPHEAREMYAEYEIEFKKGIKEDLLRWDSDMKKKLGYDFPWEVWGDRKKLWDYHMYEAPLHTTVKDFSDLHVPMMSQIFASMFGMKTDMFGRGRQTEGFITMIDRLSKLPMEERKDFKRGWLDYAGFGFRIDDKTGIPTAHAPELPSEFITFMGEISNEHAVKSILDLENMTSKQLEQIKDVLVEFPELLARDISGEMGPIISGLLRHYINYEKFLDIAMRAFRIDGKRAADILDDGRGKDKRGEGTVKSLARPHFRYRTGS